MGFAVYKQGGESDLCTTGAEDFAITKREKLSSSFSQNVAESWGTSVLSIGPISFPFRSCQAIEILSHCLPLHH